VIPATIGILDGELIVGLSQGEIKELALNQQGVLKAGARDLGYVCQGNDSAGTTVSGTLAAAGVAGIEVFATGGIGGVHRGASDTFDVSADLAQLSRSPVVVISAGCKAILDIPKTLEVLETLGVPVIGFQTQVFPAFYSSQSSETLDIQAKTPDQIAEIFRIQNIQTPGVGMLVANPIPREAELPNALIEGWLEQALAQPGAKELKGKAVTPHLLAALVAYSGGRCLSANIALVRNNVALACQVAKALI
jgi:pseudouridylate synthase